MQTFKNIDVLILDDADFIKGKEGDPDGIRGSVDILYNSRIIMWRGVVLKNNLGDSADRSVVFAAQMEREHQIKE